ncbi:MAG: reverse transcriptase family protein [Bacteroidota bacterium]
MNPTTIATFRQLANFLRCEEDFLTAYLGGDHYLEDRRHSTPMPPITRYTSVIQKLYLPKKSGAPKSFRETFSIRTDTLKNALKGLNTYLQHSFEPSDAVHGYVADKNIRTNAEAHLGRKYLLSVDIHKFFESINSKMVEASLKQLGYSDFAALHISRFTTLNDFLPPGFNTSPTLSNLVVHEMDIQFLALCGNDCTYTRYADDLYFSSDSDLPSLPSIEKIIGSHGFSLSPQKTKYMNRGRKQYVTGLTVFDHVRPHVSRSIKRNLRLELHYMQKYGMRDHMLHELHYTRKEYDSDPDISIEVGNALERLDNAVAGWIHYMKSVEPTAAARFEAIYKKIVL